MEREPEFTADEEMVDSLRMEASVLSPEEQGQVESLASRMSRIVRSNYLSLMPLERVEQTEGIDKRIIVTDKETFQRFDKEWVKESNRMPSLPPHVAGAAYSWGRFIVLKDFRNAWEEMPAEAKEQLMERLKSEKDSKEIAAKITLIDALSHEVAHQFQDFTLPVAFLECGATYYQYQIISQLREGPAISRGGPQLARFYRYLVQEFGDDVHRLFFGRLIDPKRSESILSRFTPEVMGKLFPSRNTESDRSSTGSENGR